MLDHATWKVLGGLVRYSFLASVRSVANDRELLVASQWAPRMGGQRVQHLPVPSRSTP